MRFLERRPGRAAGEERVVIGDDRGTRAAHGLWFWGRVGIHPWADLVVTDPSVIPDVVAALGAGGSIMVGYGGDETERALRRKVPPAATPLGLILLRAGCRWFKDWYFPEGGREGGTKLQGTVPLDAGRKARAEADLIAELERFLRRSDGRAEDAAWAREALQVLGVAR
jgi:hypothetical protein